MEWIARVNGSLYCPQGFAIFPPQSMGPRTDRYELYEDDGAGNGRFLGQFKTLDKAKEAAERLVNT